MGSTATLVGLLWPAFSCVPPRMDSIRPRTSAATVLACALWLSAVTAALIGLMRISNSPGESGAPCVRWPVQSDIPLDRTRPTLILFAHPRCPCTRATIGELELLLTHCSGRLTTHVVFIRPAGTARDWVETDLWRRVCSLAGVAVHSDEAGIETRRFHSKTSGHAMLYNMDGRLIFQGGITRARGHSGDNPGRSAVIGLLENKLPLDIKTPVFGCPLFDAECEKGRACGD
jgi:hypothetical protein